MRGLNRVGLGLWKTGPLSSFLPETRALLSRMTTPPSLGKAAKINTYMETLVDAGVIDALDGFYIFDQETEQATTQNWVQNAYNLTKSGTLTFAANDGITGDATTGFYDPGANPSTLNSGAAKFKQNSATIFHWNLTTVGSPAFSSIGCRQGATNFLDLLKDATQFIRPRVNIAPATSTQVSGAETLGLQLASRVSSATVNFYRNGSLVSALSHTSNAPPDARLLIFAQGVDTSSAGAYSPEKLFAAGFGGALTEAQQLAIYNGGVAYRS